MYEEYQTNPNPGFDPRQRYEDAGGYLRSVLGSFLNQKRYSEEEAAKAAEAEAERKSREKLVRMQSPVNQYAEVAGYADQMGATGEAREKMIKEIMMSGRETALDKAYADQVKKQQEFERTGITDPAEAKEWWTKTGRYAPGMGVHELDAASSERVAQINAEARKASATSRGSWKEEAKMKSAKNPYAERDRSIIARAQDAADVLYRGLSGPDSPTDEQFGSLYRKADFLRKVNEVLKEWRNGEMFTTPLTEKQIGVLQAFIKSPWGFYSTGEDFSSSFYEPPSVTKLEDGRVVLYMNGKYYQVDIPATEIKK